MKIGFIGCGNMGAAMIGGILDSGSVTGDEVMASARSAGTRKKIQEELKIRLGEDNRQVARFAKILFLAVKPQYYEEVIREIREEVKPDTLVISIAPGKTLCWLKEQFGRELKIIRAMPNTPAMVKAGMTGLCANDLVTEEELKQVLSLMKCFGRAQVVPEHLMDVVPGVSGSSPAYVFLFIEALADGAVAEGMPRAQAYEFAAQAVLGSAKLMLETGLHPGALKDMVCSPGGTTIEAVEVLEEKGLRSAVIAAERACIRKSRDM